MKRISFWRIFLVAVLVLVGLTGCSKDDGLPEEPIEQPAEQPTEQPAEQPTEQPTEETQLVKPEAILGTWVATYSKYTYRFTFNADSTYRSEYIVEWLNAESQKEHTENNPEGTYVLDTATGKITLNATWQTKRYWKWVDGEKVDFLEKKEEFSETQTQVFTFIPKGDKADVTGKYNGMDLTVEFAKE